ncbi:hypothetical protein BCV69DRAFT_151620 [Microstroma glucosiphilum]|uniref:Phenylacetaldoxime dehydratase n=1 Tax=Pseudomicrostroma glucosiphilum TaxID=1684307 RepID=A0A316UBR4_9BASI|nr:hypothetical protein BCV69DRAFT_151620 [Pseudomicrostroma glucosiphilum]PWN22609.1 hypothetical protein BCV69DRAFT_151620 [Pseudomicrostroma glucosiphilum]
MTLESAICPHLRRDRTLPKSTPANYVPPFPVFSARFDEDMQDVAMVMLGAVSSEDNTTLDYDALVPLDRLLELGSPLHGHRTLCTSTDPQTLRQTRAWKAWWPSRRDFEDWRLSSGFAAWFAGEEREKEDIGWFVEAIFPSMDRFETVFSNAASLEGAAVLSSHMSGAIEEHGYWGSARDRFAVGQHDPMSAVRSACPVAGLAVRAEGPQKASGSPRPQQISSKRVIVPGQHNLCVIHSGQDWSQMTGSDRDLYLHTLHPVLERGMSFLAHQKVPLSQRETSAAQKERRTYGCYDCRFMDHLDASSLESSLSKSFGLAYFDSLSSLEAWAREHKTHLDIFNGFFKYATETQGKGDLRLWHEICVLKEDQQYYEYINCPPGTGMYVGLAARVNTSTDLV